MSQTMFLLKIFVLKCYCFDDYLHPEKVSFCSLLTSSKTAGNSSVIYDTIATVGTDDVMQNICMFVCVFL